MLRGNRFENPCTKSFGSPVSSVNVERAFLNLRMVKRKERVHINEESLEEYT